MRTIATVFAALWISLVSAAQESALLTRKYVVVADRTSNSVLRFETDGTFKDRFVRAGNNPEAVTFGPDQNIYISKFGTGVERYNGATGKYIGLFAGAPLSNPNGLTFGPDADLYVVDRARSAVLRFDGATGAYIDDFVKPGAGGYNNAGGLTFGPDGHLYVTSGTPPQNNPGADLSPQILRFNGSTGAFIDVFVRTGDGGLRAPFTLIFGPDRNLYVASVFTNSVLRYNGKTGAFIDAFIGAKSGGLEGPTGLTFGPDGDLYVASSFGANVGILRYDGTTGTFIDTFIRAGTGGMAGPTDVVFYPFEALIARSGRDTTIAAGRLDRRIVGWVENGVVKGQVFDRDGKSVGPVHALSPETESASQPRIIATADGSSLTVWVTNPAGGGGTRVYARPLSAEGVPTGPPREISLPPLDFRDESPAVALVGSKAVVCWSRKDASGRGIVVARLIDATTGSPLAGEVSVSGAVNSSNDAPVIASDSSNLVAIAWRRQNVGSSPNAILLSFTTGTLGSFSSRVVDDGSEGVVGAPSISANAAGLVMLAWPSTTLEADITTHARPRVRIKVLSAGSGAGAAALPNIAVSQPFTANADEYRQASSPQITVGRNGVAGVVWQYEGLLGGTGIYGRAVDVTGVVDKTDFVVFDAVDNTEAFSSPAIAMDSTATLTISSHKTVAGVSSVFTRTRLQVRTGQSRRRAVRH
jgi:hypothetical protein